ncbi:SpoVR family protein, partial [Effusibacillus consociatus]
KIMNEGWATYWHLRIMRELDLTEDETIDFARMNAGVILPSRTSINPYHVGLKMWEDIEKRWNNPTKEERERWGRQPGLGREKMFEIREVESDISFLRNYLTKDLVEELDLYLYQKVGNEWKIVEKDWEKVRDQLCAARVNGGFPVLLVQDGDYLRNGELYIKHEYEGVELDVKYLEKTLPYVHRLWGRPVHI